MKLFKFLPDVCIAVINANCDYFKELTARKMICFVHTLLNGLNCCLFWDFDDRVNLGSITSDILTYLIRNYNLIWASIAVRVLSKW